MGRHEEALQKYLNEYKSKGYKTIRLDHRGVPDAIVLIDGKLHALLIDTSSITTLNLIKIFKGKRGQKIRDYSEYDSIIQVVPKMRCHTQEEYDMAMKLYNEGKTTYRIANTLKISHTVIYEWTHYGVKPFTVMQDVPKNTTVFYDDIL